MHDAVAAAEILEDDFLITKARELIPFAPRFYEVRRPEYPALTIELLSIEIQKLAQFDNVIQHCLDRNLKRALEVTDCSRAVEDAAVTFACLAEFELASAAAKHHSLEGYRRRAISEVILIEAHRRNNIPLFQSTLMELNSVPVWGYFVVSLGMLGRRPWDPYPYADW